MPPQETEFIQAIEQNAVKRRSERRAALRALLPSLKVEDWVGTIDFLLPQSGGFANLNIKLPSSVEILLRHHGPVDTVLKHHPNASPKELSYIEKGSPLYNALSDLKKGDLVTFSGEFTRGWYGGGDPRPAFESDLEKRTFGELARGTPKRPTSPDEDTLDAVTPDYLDEESLTASGSMRAPYFRFIFSRIALKKSP
jgi:hypothetical protein